MILEATVIVSEWLKNPTHGVNALLASIPRNKIKGGVYPKPEKVTIYDDCTDDCVAMELQPEATPAVVVFCDSEIRYDMDMQDHSDQKKGQKAEGLTMVAAYMVADKDPIEARQEGNFVLRAVKNSLNRYNNPRTRGRKTVNDHGILNDVHVVKISDLRVQRVAGSVGQLTLAGFVLATLWLYDRRPG